MKLKFRSMISLCLVVLMNLSVIASATTAYGVEGVMIDYKFCGENSKTVGYAQGKITITSQETQDYYLYWANDEKALDGYYEISKLHVEAGKSAEFDFGYHTVIPFGATKIIATANADMLTVADAVAVYEIPEEKRLKTGAGELKYTFNSYSDVHIDTDGFYKNYEEKWAQALQFAVNKKADFIVSSGDMVNNGTELEWDIYQRILADSDFVNPVYESDGNHDIRQSVTTGLKNFVRATGTDNTIDNYNANKPYYYVTEKNTGDIFKFMALEGDYKTHTVESFSQEQLNWLKNLLETNYGTGKNIFIVEHAPINGFGAGDRMENPLYGSHLSEEFWATVKFKSLLEKYPDLIWMSGHTHIDFTEGYNYSDENGKACNMIHNSAVIGSTKPNATDDGLDYNDGNGFNSQGYFVEVYDNNVVYYGANLTDEKIYPAYSYIMEGASKSVQTDTNDTNEVTTATTVEVAPVVKLPGSFNEWSTVEMTIADGIATMTLELTAGEYKFKIMENDTWLGNTGIIYDTTEATSVNGWDMSSSVSDNCTLQATGGKYTFKYNYKTDRLIVLHNIQNETESTEAASSEPIVENIMGDVNKDGRLDINDVTLIQKALAQLIIFTEEQEVLAEVDGNGVVNIKDATKIQRIIANIDTEKTSLVASGSEKAESMITDVDSLLNKTYSFASYNQYQELKKIYLQNKDEVMNENLSQIFKEKIEELNAIVEHIGCTKIYRVQDTYYFVNTLGWQKIYAYAWTPNTNGDWPGVELEKVGTYGSYDVYGIKFKKDGEYMNIIFNDGSNNQTLDIDLYRYQNNCFKVDSGNMSSGKYIPENFQYDNPDKEPTAPTEPVILSEYALRYYNGSAHKWDDVDTFFIKQEDGSYLLDFTTQNSDSISLNVFNNEKGIYNCIATSTPIDYISGVENTFNLVSGTSRGKSITINGLSQGVNIKFIYKPEDNTLKIIF